MQVLVGEPGIGKNALLSNWVKRRWATKHRDEFLFQYFAGASTRAKQLPHMLHKVRAIKGAVLYTKGGGRCCNCTVRSQCVPNMCRCHSSLCMPSTVSRHFLPGTGILYFYVRIMIRQPVDFSYTTSTVSCSYDSSIGIRIYLVMTPCTRAIPGSLQQVY